jgi:hypothetical protein
MREPAERFAGGAAMERSGNGRNWGSQLNSSINNTRHYAARGVAAALASPPTMALSEGKQYLGLETSNYDGETALGLGYSYQASKYASVNLAVSGTPGSGPVAVRGGVGITW